MIFQTFSLVPFCFLGKKASNMCDLSSSMNGSFKSNSSFSSSKMFLVESKFVANEEIGASDYSICVLC